MASISKEGSSSEKAKLDSDLEATETKEPEPPPDTANKFQNDGSFMEMFKRRMQEQQQEQQQNKEPSAAAAKPQKSGNSSAEVLGKYDRLQYATQAMTYKDSGEGVKSSTSKSTKPQYQGIIGKRKTLMRSVELREKRKKHQEEMEEQQNAELKEQKSSAWKSYMAEVKAYEARRCGDGDDHKRPLVK